VTKLFYKEKLANTWQRTFVRGTYVRRTSVRSWYHDIEHMFDCN